MTTETITEQGIEAVLDAYQPGWRDCNSCIRESIKSDMKAALEAYEKSKWRPINSLILEYRHGYAVSKSVSLLINYPETNQQQVKFSRVWEENAERSLPDLSYVEYERVSHWQPLPTPPQGDEG